MVSTGVFADRPRTTPAGSPGGRRQGFLLGLSADVVAALSDFAAVHLGKTGALDLEYFVEAQCMLAAALGQEPDAIATTSTFFGLVGVANGGSHLPRDVIVKWQANHDLIKHVASDKLALTLRRVTRELLEKRKEAHPASKQGHRAMLDSRTRDRALIEAFSEDRNEQQRQREVQAAEQHALKSRKQAAEQNFLAMLASEKKDKEAQRSALEREVRFLQQAAVAEGEARRRMGGRDRAGG